MRIWIASRNTTTATASCAATTSSAWQRTRSRSARAGSYKDARPRTHRRRRLRHRVAGPHPVETLQRICDDFDRQQDEYVQRRAHRPRRVPRDRSPSAVEVDVPLTTPSLAAIGGITSQPGAAPGVTFADRRVTKEERRSNRRFAESGPQSRGALRTPTTRGDCGRSAQRGVMRSLTTRPTAFSPDTSTYRTCGMSKPPSVRTKIRRSVAG